MCFSRNESIAAFVVGTVINAVVIGLLLKLPRYNRTKWPRVAIACMWQFALLMQIPEAIQWSYLDQGLDTPSYINPLAYWLNNLQPLVAFLGVALAVGLTTNIAKREPAALPAAGVMPVLFTIFTIVYFQSSMAEQADIRPGPTCNHLDLHWWQNNIRPLIGFYIMGILAALILIPDYQRYIQVAVFLGTFILANALYRCGVGSIWCWMVAPASLTLLF